MSRMRMLVLGIMLVLGVGVLALNVLPVMPVLGTHAMLAYDLPRVSANTQVSHPGLFLFDGREDSAWNADCDGRDIWVELDLSEPKDIEGLRLFKTDTSAVTVLFETDGWWIPAPCPDLAGLIGWQDIDLSPLEIASSRIRLVLRPKAGAAFAGLGEVEVLGRAHQVDPRRLAPVTVWQSGNNDVLGAANLFDGNTNSVWNTTSASGPVWAEADLSADTSIISVRLFATGTPVSQCSVMLRQAGQWIGIPELSSINGLKAGWNEVRLARSIRADAVRLESRGAGSPGGWLGEVEIWGCPIGTALMNAWMSGATAGFRGAFDRNGTSPASDEVLTWVSESAKLSFNGGEPVSLAPGLSRLFPERSQLLAGRNGFEIKGSPQAGVLLKQRAADGRLMVNAPDCAVVIDGKTTTNAVFGMSQKDMVLVLDRPAFMDHLRVFLSEPGQQNIEVSLWDGKAWISPSEGSRTAMSVAQPGWYAIPVNGSTERLRLSSTYAVTVAEIQCFGSPISEAAPSVMILEPVPGKIVGETVPVAGRVDNPNATVIVNGQPASLVGDRFSATVRLGTGSDGKITVVATDGSGRAGSAEVSVCPGSIMTLSKPANGYMTASGTVTVAGTVGDPASAVKINGSSVPLRGRDFSQSVTLTPGFNRIRIDAQLRSGAAVALTRIVYHDTEAPAVRLLTPLDGEVTSGSTVRIVGVVEDLLPTGVLVNDVEAKVQGNLFMAEAPVSEGENQIRIEAKDALGRVSVLETTVEFDAKAPEITIDAPEEGILEKATVDVVGRVAEANLTSLTVNGKTVVPDKSGKFTLKSVQLKEGLNRLEVRAQDAAGHTTTQSVEVTLDTLAPEPFTPTLNPDGWTNRDQVEVAFVAADAGTGVVRYEMKLDNGQIAPAVSPVMVGNLGEGRHKVFVRAYDRLGRFSEGEAEIKIDRTAPEPFVPTASPSQWTSRLVTVSFGAKDALSGVARFELSIDGGSAIAVTSPYTLPTLSDGEHTVHITAFDQAGNKVESSVEVYTDATPPEGFDLTVSPAGWSGSRKLTVSFSTTDATSGIDKYQVRVNAGKWADAASPADVVVPSDGQHVIEVRALDRAGRETIARAEASVDTAPPAEFETKITPEGWTNNPEPVVTFETADAGSGIDHYEVAVDDWKPVAAESPYTCPKLKDGEHTITVRAIDGVGNVRVSEVTASIDTTAPAAPAGFDVLPGHEKAEIIWDKGPKEIAEYRLRRVTGVGARIIAVPAPAHKYFDRDTANGFRYEYTIQAIDRAGNVSLESKPIEVVPGRARVRYHQRDGQISLMATEETSSTEVSMSGMNLTIPGVPSVYTPPPPGVKEIFETEIVVDAATISPGELPSVDDGSVLVGNIFVIGQKVTDETHGEYLVDVDINQESQLVLGYENLVPQGFSERDLHLYRYNTEAESWQRVEGTQLDVISKGTKDATKEMTTYAIRASHFEGPTASESARAAVSPYDSYFGSNGESVGDESGTLSLNIEDVRLPGVNGLDAVVSRRYSSATAYSQFRDTQLNGASSEVRTHLSSWRSLGLGWEFNIPWVEVDNEKETRIHFSDGSSHPLGERWGTPEYGHFLIFFTYRIRAEYVFMGNGDEEVFRTTFELSNPSDRHSMKIHTVRTREGLTYRFENERVVWVKDLNGNTITYTYEITDAGESRLSKITDTIGREIIFSYQNGRVHQISWPAAERTATLTYGFDSQKDLNSVTDTLGRITTYDYYRADDFGVPEAPVIDDHTDITVESSGVAPATTLPASVSGQQAINTVVKLIREIRYPSGGYSTYAYNCDTYTEDVGYQIVTPSPTDPSQNTTVSYTTSYQRTWVSISLRAEYQRGKASPHSVTHFAPTSSTVGSQWEGGTREYISKMVTDDGKGLTEKSFGLFGPIERNCLGGIKEDHRVSRCTEVLIKQGEDVLAHKKYDYENTAALLTKEYTMNGTQIERTIESDYDSYRNLKHRWDNGTGLEEWWSYSNNSSYNNPGIGSFQAITSTSKDTYGVLAFVLNYSVKNVVPGDVPKTQYLQTQVFYDLEWNATEEWRWNGTAWDKTVYTYYPRGQRKTQTAPPSGGVAGPTTTYYYDGTDNSGANLWKVVDHVTDVDGVGSDVITEFGYYPNGLVQWKKDPRSGQPGYPAEIKSWYYYDALGRLTSVTLSDGSTRTYQHNDGGDYCDVTDEEGRVTRYQYDGLNHLVEEIRDLYGFKAKKEYGYSPQWKTSFVTEPHKVTEPASRYTANYEYDVLGRTTKVQFAHDETIPEAEIPAVSIRYDWTTNITTATDEEGHITKEMRDRAGRLVEATAEDIQNGVPVTRKWTYQYDSLGRRIIETDPKGGKSYSEYDYLGNLVSKKAPSAVSLYPENSESTVTVASRTTFGYDARGNVVWKIGPNGNVASTADTRYKAEYKYDELNRLIRVQEPIDSGHYRITKVYYDAAGNKTKVIDGNSLSINYGYDLRNRLISETNAMGQKISYGYDKVGNRTSITDPRGNDTATEDDFTAWLKYDTLHRLERVTLPDKTPGDRSDNPYAETTYTLNGQKDTVRDPMGIVTCYTYYPRNLVETVTTDGVVVAKYAYDRTGKVIRMTDAENLTTNYEYDGMGEVIKKRVVREDHLLQNPTYEVVTRYQYDELGLKVREWDQYDPLKQVIYAYDAQGRLVSTKDAQRNIRLNEYDPAGNLRRVTDPRQNKTVYRYNLIGWLTEEVDSKNKSAFFTYDLGGRRITEEDRKQQITAYAYYDNNLLHTATSNDGVAVTYEYDAAGNRIHVSQNSNPAVETWYNYDSNSQSYTYDPMNRINTVTRSIGNYTYVVGYAYDAAGSLTGIQYPGSTKWVTYSRDSFGRVTNVGMTGNEEAFTRKATEGELLFEGVTYGKTGVLKRIQMANGINLDLQPDELHRPTAVDYRTVGAESSSLKLEYAYKPHQANIGSIDKTGTAGLPENMVYDYDRLDQLVTERPANALIQATTLGSAYVEGPIIPGAEFAVTYSWNGYPTNEHCLVETTFVDATNGTILGQFAHDPATYIGGIGTMGWSGPVYYSVTTCLPQTAQYNGEVWIVVSLVGDSGARVVLSRDLTSMPEVSSRCYRAGTFVLQTIEDTYHNNLLSDDFRDTSRIDMGATTCLVDTQNRVVRAQTSRAPFERIFKDFAQVSRAIDSWATVRTFQVQVDPTDRVLKFIYPVSGPGKTAIYIDGVKRFEHTTSTSTWITYTDTFDATQLTPDLHTIRLDLNSTAWFDTIYNSTFEVQVQRELPVGGEVIGSSVVDTNELRFMGGAASTSSWSVGHTFPQDGSLNKLRVTCTAKVPSQGGVLTIKVNGAVVSCQSLPYGAEVIRSMDVDMSQYAEGSGIPIEAIYGDNPVPERPDPGDLSATALSMDVSDSTKTKCGIEVYLIKKRLVTRKYMFVSRLLQTKAEIGSISASADTSGTVTWPGISGGNLVQIRAALELRSDARTIPEIRSYSAALNTIAPASQELPPSGEGFRSFFYDGAGNRSSVVEGGVGSELRIDEQSDRLNSVGAGSSSSATFSYDDNGNMVSRTENGINWIYVYDARNRMIEVMKDGLTVANYLYDPEGNRVQANYGGNQVTNFIYDLTGQVTENPIVEDEPEGMRRNYVYLNRALLVRVDGTIDTGTKYWYLTDHLGSTRGLTDDTGRVVWSVDYEAFGQFKNQAGEKTDEVPRFTGKTWDVHIGLYYFNARWYDPGLGRFTSEDPLGDPNNPNLYSYCSSNPLSHTDPTGLYEDEGPETVPGPSADGSSIYTTVDDKGNQTVHVVNKEGKIEYEETRDPEGRLVCTRAFEYETKYLPNGHTRIQSKMTQAIFDPTEDDPEEALAATITVTATVETWSQGGYAHSNKTVKTEVAIADTAAGELYAYRLNVTLSKEGESGILQNVISYALGKLMDGVPLGDEISLIASIMADFNRSKELLGGLGHGLFARACTTIETERTRSITDSFGFCFEEHLDSINIYDRKGTHVYLEQNHHFDGNNIWAYNMGWMAIWGWRSYHRHRVLAPLPGAPLPF